MASLPQGSPVFIYGLCDPRTGELRYVGKTARKHLRFRLDQHVSDAKAGKGYHCHRWIRLLLEHEIRPEIFAIETTTQEQWEEDERFWIAYFRGLGCDLTNRTDGGMRFKPTWETLEKLAAANRNRPPWNKGKPLPDSVRRHISEAKKGRPAKNKGVLWSEKAKAKVRGKPSPMRGKQHTPEAKQKCGVRNRGNTYNAKEYRVIPPTGDSFIVRNLSLFCRENGLTVTALVGVASGLRPHHRGWKAARL